MTQNFNNNIQQLQRQFIASLPQKANQLTELWHHLRYLRWSEQSFKNFQQLSHRLIAAGTTFGRPDISESARLLDEYLVDCHAQGQSLGGVELARVNELVTALSGALANSGDANNLSHITPPEIIGAGKNILLIEADHALSALLMVYLRKAGFTVLHYDSVAAAIPHLEQACPQGVLIDPGLTDEGGIAFSGIAHIKSHLAPSVPIIFLSARGDMHTRLHALRAGCSNFITKPIDCPTLINTLGHTCAQHKQATKIMIVDDDETMAQLHAEILRYAGMEVIYVTQPAQSLKRATEFQPDLVLLDMHMPTIDGLELATLLRQNEQFMLLPIIFVTADDSFKLRQTIESFGVNAILNKPVDMGELVNLCERAVNHTAALKQRIEAKGRRTQYLNQVSSRHFFAAIANELQTDISHATPTALYYLQLDVSPGLREELGPIGVADLHHQFCKRLANIVGSDELWSDIDNFIACILVGTRPQALHLNRLTQLAAQISHTAYPLGNDVYLLSTSTGLHYLDAERGDANAAIRQAALACDFSKKSVAPSPEIPDAHTETLVAAAAGILIDDYLPKENLRVCYQPMINLDNPHIEHFEVLVRWCDKDEKLIPAAKFLHHIKQSKLRIELDRWVLQTSVDAISANNYARENASLFIHLTAETLTQNLFYSFVTNVLRSSRLRGQQRLIFIFEEPWVATHPDEAAAALSTLQKVECGACLSHVSATATSRQILKKLPFNYVRLAPNLTTDLAISKAQQDNLTDFMAEAVAAGAEVIVTQLEDTQNLSTLWMQGARLFQGFVLQAPDKTLHTMQDMKNIKQHFGLTQNNHTKASNPSHFL